MFFSLHDAKSSDRVSDITEYILDYLSVEDGDVIYIMDPYLDVWSDIQTAITDKDVDEDLWGLLILFILDSEIEVRIISRSKEPKDSIIIRPESYPSEILLDDKNSKLLYCLYRDTKYGGLALHDRYILKSSKEDGNLGLHVGCSLADIQDKDLSITKYSDIGLNTAIARFDELWNFCVGSRI